MSKKRRAKKQPMQPIEWDGKGVLRFKCNPIVEFLLYHGGFDLNDLVRVRFNNTLPELHKETRPHFVRQQEATYEAMKSATKQDWDQFYQLIGYSVSGCPYQKKQAIRKARRRSDKYLAKFPRDKKVKS